MSNSDHDNPVIEVRIYPERLASPIVARLRMDHSLFVDIFSRIDQPSQNANVFERMMCTPDEVITHVKRLREGAASMLSKAPTKAILQAMESRDLRSGYPKD